jgi:RNAse (barnase) inhibitor barstar
MTKEYVIEGMRISSIWTFYDEISRVLIPGARWGRNLDAFNDILRGGFGTPEDGFTLVWNDSAISRKQLGVPTFDQLVEIILDHGVGGEQHEDNVTLLLK